MTQSLLPTSQVHRSVILEQVEMGVAVRQAVLEILSQTKPA